MGKIQWLHFSDLHLNQRGVETRRLRDRLPEYLEKLGVRCDYAFCTGDIRHAPSGEFSTDHVDRIQRICGAVGVPTDRLFIVPGNHDVDRGAAGRTEAIRRIYCTSAPASPGYYSASEGTILSKDIAEIAAGQRRFCELLQRLYQDVPGRAELYASSTAPHFVVQTNSLNILHLDSTITYSADQQRDLVIGAELLQNALDTVDQTKPTILLTHYSFDYLCRDEQREIHQLLQDYHVQLWLAGHEHDHLCRQQWDTFYEFQCGNLVLENGAKSCILLGSLDLDTGHGEVRVHAWFPQGGWAKYPFARTGADDNTVYPFHLDLPERSGGTAPRQEEVNALEACRSLENAGGQFYHVRFRQELMPDIQWGQNIFENRQDGNPLLSAMEALRQDMRQTGAACHALLLGDGGMGKSTMLFDACKHTILDQHIPAAFISLQTLQGLGYKIESHILRTLYHAENEASRDSLLSLLNQRTDRPGLMLFVDGFNELNSDTAYQYAAELKQLARFPGVQIVVSSRLDFLRDYGMAHFQMLRTCDLRDAQISTLFDEEDWQDILSKRHLHILLKNPMMALLYAQTCPVIERYQDLEFCDWKLPISNAADLLHDFYLAQAALLVGRDNADKGGIYLCFCAVKYILPRLAFQAEHSNAMGWADTEFEDQFRQAIQSAGCELFDNELPPLLSRIKRIYRLRLERPLPEDGIYDAILSEHCLLRSGSGRVSFPHQIFRDYLAAVYLCEQLLRTGQASPSWHEDPIHAGVIQYLRHMHGTLWGDDGLMTRLLAPYRGQELTPGDHFVENLVNCWLSEDAEADVTRDLSGLDFRKISLAEHLKRKYQGTILLSGARVSKQTFVNERRHDRIVGLAFSHDSRTLAAVSANGIVSVSNILTQSQMIVGEVSLEGSVSIGYTAEDYLMLRSGSQAYIWPTITYDKIDEPQPGDEILTMEQPVRNADAAQRLEAMLRDSNLLGSQHTVSDDRLLLATGYVSGHIQVWDAREQNCIVELSLGDSQVVTASFSPDGTLAALGAGGSLVQLWDVRNKQCRGVLHFERPVRRVRFPAELDIRKKPVLECEYSDGRCFRVDLDTGKREEYQHSRKLLQIQKKLREKLKGEAIQKIDLADNGNGVIMLKNSPKLWVWDQRTHALNPCKGHMSAIQDAAICKADPRFAASYSNEKFHAKWRQDRRLEGQKLVRTWAIRKGNCMHRLSTNGMTIKRLQFFTANRIILAGFASNGDIILWELINKVVNGEERGHWNLIETVRDGPAEPLECAVSSQGEFLLIGVYRDGTLFSRTFSGSFQSSFRVFPGIDLTSVKRDDLICEDEVKQILRWYQS